jgi:hypothetical protein
LLYFEEIMVSNSTFSYGFILLLFFFSFICICNNFISKLFENLFGVFFSNHVEF